MKDTQPESQDQPHKKRRETLIQQATSPEWGDTHAEEIGHTIENIIAAEIVSANTHRELWTLPADAEIDLPGLDEATLDMAQKKWQEIHQQFRDPNRKLSLVALSTENGTTMLKYDAELGLLRQNIWTCFMIQVDGAHLPIKIDRYTFGVQVNPKPELLTDDEHDALVLALTQRYTGKSEDNAESLKALQQERSAVVAQESLALHTFINDPKQYSHLFRPEVMQVVEPGRLMTEEEVTEWNTMLHELVQSGSVVVGVPPYGSYCRFESNFQFGLGLTLKTTMLKENDEPAGTSFSLHVPVRIHQGEKTLGWLICDVSVFPSLTKSYVSFEHGNDDIYWYKHTKHPKSE